MGWRDIRFAGFAGSSGHLEGSSIEPSSDSCASVDSEFQAAQAKTKKKAARPLGQSCIRPGQQRPTSTRSRTRSAGTHTPRPARQESRPPGHNPLGMHWTPSMDLINSYPCIRGSQPCRSPGATGTTETRDTKTTLTHHPPCCIYTPSKPQYKPAKNYTPQQTTQSLAPRSPYARPSHPTAPRRYSAPLPPATARRRPPRPSRRPSPRPPRG